MDKFDYIELERRLQKLTRKQRLYRLLKYELTKLGYWQNKQRGNPSKGGQVTKSKQSNQEYYD